MTKLQKLQIKQSEYREQLNTLLQVDEKTDEQTAEMRSLTTGMTDLEPEIRAAVVVQATEEAEAQGQFGNGDGESAEVRSLMITTTLSDYFGAVAAKRSLEGRAAELNTALGADVVGKSGGRNHSVCYA